MLKPINTISAICGIVQFIAWLLQVSIF